MSRTLSRTSSTIEDVANLDVPLPSCQAEKNEKRKTNYKQVLSIQSDFKNRDLPGNQDEYECYVGMFHAHDRACDFI